MSKRVFFETFLNFDDAVYWMETQLKEQVQGEWLLFEAKLLYVNFHWSVSIMTTKSQGEMFYED